GLWRATATRRIPAVLPHGLLALKSLLESFLITMDTTKKGLFTTEDGQNLAFTFILVSSLFFLWAVCNGMIDVMDKHFQEELGHKRYAATRINLAQSCNGVGWIFGPIIGSVYFYSKDAAGASTGSQTLYIPYVAVALGSIAIAAIFYFANVPDIKAPDDYHLDDTVPVASHSIWSHPDLVRAVAAQFSY